MKISAKINMIIPPVSFVVWACALTGLGLESYIAMSLCKLRCNCICRPLPSNQSFYRQIAGYRMGVGDHRVG